MTTNTKTLTLWILAAVVLLSGTVPAWADQDCCGIAPGCCESDADGGATSVAVGGGCGCTCFDQSQDPLGPVPAPRLDDQSARVTFSLVETDSAPIPWPIAAPEIAVGRESEVFSGTDVRARTCARLL